MRAIRRAVLVFLALLVVSGTAYGEPLHEVDQNEKCPVCGMFVASYEQWLSQIIRGGDAQPLVFDGVKDMMVFYFSPEDYGGASREAIRGIFVKDYYSLKSLPGKEAFYVVGSDVYGPMGHELIPFTTEEDARTFMMDHRGKRLLRFWEVTPEVIGALD